ncbi:MAG: pilus assembly protein [Planctomycetales bacterium]|nr:pilus assembly protein [Planctomycetales bacterium]
MLAPTRFATQRRRAAATVEFALVAPLLFLTFFAAVEFSRANMVRHTVDIAAYEGARQGIIPGATADDVRNRVNQIMAQLAIRNTTVTVTPATIDRNTDRVTVNVVTPMQGNGFITGLFMNSAQLSAESTLCREGFTSPSS